MKNLRIILIILLSLVSLALVGLLGKKTIDKLRDSDQKNVKTPESTVLDSIDQFILYNDTNDYQKSLFDQFKIDFTGFQAETTDLEEYLESYTKNFLADYLTLSVKNSETKRLGGLTYIEKTLQDAFSDNFETQLYYSMIYSENIDQEMLPNVENLELDTIEEKIIRDKRTKKKLYSNYVLVFDVTYSDPIQNPDNEDDESSDEENTSVEVNTDDEDDDEKTDITRIERIKVEVTEYNEFWTILSIEDETEKYREVFPIS